MYQNARYSFSMIDSGLVAQDGLMSGPIVLVNNDKELNHNIHEFLRDNGFTVIVETSGRRGKVLIESLEPIMVILDIVLPDVDGLTICRDVRSNYAGPILIISALTNDIDEVASLETGADGYLTKPIQPRVLLAHIRALLRRHSSGFPEQAMKPSQQLSNQALPALDNDTLNVGRIRISLATRTVWMNGNRFDMTSGEFDILWCLASHTGQILSRDKLYYQIRGMEYDGMDRAIDQHISNIRKKFDDDPKTPTIIKSVRGVGYLLAG